MKKDKMLIICMDDKKRRDVQASGINGIEAVVSFVDSAGQIHLEGYGLALIPGVDDFVLID